MGTKPQVTAPERRGLRSRIGNWLRPGRHELTRARRAADDELLRLSPAPPRLAWRSAELTAGAKRLELARELRKVVGAADSRHLPNASPIDRPQIRVESEALLSLAERLAELSRPVSPGGVLLLERLLHDRNGPLYEGAPTTTLGGAIEEIAAALDWTA